MRLPVNSPLPHAVLHIVFLSPYEQMPKINTVRIIATVTNKLIAF